MSTSMNVIIGLQNVHQVPILPLAHLERRRVQLIDIINERLFELQLCASRNEEPTERQRKELTDLETQLDQITTTLTTVYGFQIMDNATEVFEPYGVAEDEFDYQEMYEQQMAVSAVERLENQANKKQRLEEEKKEKQKQKELNAEYNKHKDEWKDEDFDDLCTICYTNKELTEPIMKCKHTFCESCCKKLKECPICRK